MDWGLCELGCDACVEVSEERVKSVQGKQKLSQELTPQRMKTAWGGGQEGHTRRGWFSQSQ